MGVCIYVLIISSTSIENKNEAEDLFEEYTDTHVEKKEKPNEEQRKKYTISMLLSNCPQTST